MSLDGVALEAPELGVAHPVDPGEHVVEATAAGKKSYRRTVTLDATTLRLTVDIPVLESVDATAAKSPTAEPNANAVDGGGPDRRTIALGVGAAGVLALGVGVTLTFVARAHYAAADDHCPQNLCDAEGLDASVSARRLMRASTITAGVGLVLVGVGAALWFTAPPRSETAASAGAARGVRAVGLTPFGFVVAGAF